MEAELRQRYEAFLLSTEQLPSGDDPLFQHMWSFRWYIFMTEDLEAFFTVPEWHQITQLDEEEIRQIATLIQEVCSQYDVHNIMSVASVIIRQNRNAPDGELEGFSMVFLALVILSGLSPKLNDLIEKAEDRAGVLYRILKYSQQENAQRLEANSPKGLTAGS